MNATTAKGKSEDDFQDFINEFGNATIPIQPLISRPSTQNQRSRELIGLSESLRLTSRLSVRGSGKKLEPASKEI